MTELNKAIFKVLINQYKKDCKEAYKMVEDAGYEIIKWGGQFHIKNLATDRIIYIHQRYNCYTINHGPNSVHHTEIKKPVYSYECPFDFVACLNKPVNKTYWEMKQARDWYQGGKAIQNYERFKSARWSVNYHSEKIEDIQKQIAKLQKDLIHEVEQRVKYQQRFDEVKRELNLK